MSPEEIRELHERLAALAHSQWSGWMTYLFKLSTWNADGSLTIPPDSAARWKRQASTPYHELPEAEKQSDREEAERVLRAMGLFSLR
jgi:hypothetical protein